MPKRIHVNRNLFVILCIWIDYLRSVFAFKLDNETYYQVRLYLKFNIIVESILIKIIEIQKKRVWS